MVFTPHIIDQLPLNDIDAVVFFRSGDMVGDPLCCEIEARGEFRILHANMPQWREVMSWLSALSGFPAEWEARADQETRAQREFVAFKSGR